MKRIVFILAVFLLSVSCSDGKVEYSDSQDVEMIRISAESFRYDRWNGTRTESGNILDFKWMSDDTVGIFPETGAQLGFPMAEGKGAAGRFDFDGGVWALKPASSYSAYYPFLGDMYLEKTGIPIRYSGQVQKRNASSAHLGPYDYMASGSVVPVGGCLSLDLRHLGALLEIRIATPEPVDLQTVEISADENVFVQTGRFNPADPDAGVTAVAAGPSIRVDLEEVGTSEDSLAAVVYCMVAPFDAKGKTIRVKVVDASGIVQVFEVEGDDYRAGMIYNIPVGLEERKFDGRECRVEVPGSLPGMIDGAEKYSLSSLKVSGELNGTDIRFIREMAGMDAEDNRTEGRLEFLDMSDVRIVAGGECYAGNYRTENNVFGDYMFYGSRLERIILPQGIKKIGEWGLAYSGNLVSISMPATLREIGASAFQKCSRLDSVFLPHGLVAVGDMAFASCSGMRSLSLPEGIKTIGYKAFIACVGLETLVLPTGLEFVGYAAFMSCRSLHDLVLQDGVKVIGGAAFANCDSLASVVLPATVEETGSGVFSSCRGLVSADLSDCRIKELKSEMFHGCIKLEDVALPGGITNIWNQAFGYCTSLKGIVLPEGLEEINWEAFYRCSALEKIVIPGSVTELARSFVGCSGLKEVIIRNGSLTEFNGGSLSFLEGVDLEKIWLPSSLKQIDSGILDSSVSLKELYCFAEEPPFLYENNDFNPSCRIYVPKGSVEKYKSHETWKSRAAFIFGIPDGTSND